MINQQIQDLVNGLEIDNEEDHVIVHHYNDDVPELNKPFELNDEKHN